MTTDGFDLFQHAALLVADNGFPELGWVVIASIVVGVAAVYGSLQFFAPSEEERAEMPDPNQAEDDANLLQGEEFEEFIVEGKIPSLVRIVGNGKDDALLASVLEQVQRERNQGFQIGVVSARTIQELIKSKKDAKHLQDTYIFDRYPQLALFRNGELVTTLDPYYDNDATTQADMRKRIRSFLIKMGV